jgi:hypothetical protein
MVVFQEKAVSALRREKGDCPHTSWWPLAMKQWSQGNLEEPGPLWGWLSAASW